jgi:hypothetical protein
MNFSILTRSTTTLALMASVGVTAAFSPAASFATNQRSTGTALHSAVQTTPTFTFTKSEEIFAEALHVRSKQDEIYT